MAEEIREILPNNTINEGLEGSVVGADNGADIVADSILRANTDAQAELAALTDGNLSPIDATQMVDHIASAAPEVNKFIVLGALVFMVWMLIRDRMRPGILLFSVVVIFLCTGILTPDDAIAGFSNKGMITVALLFLVSEGVRRSDCLGSIMKWIFPDKEHSSVRKGYIYIMGVVASASAFLNNTPIVVIFIPHIKQWAKRVGLPLKKFLIPLSYAAILGGMCTLIGTSTNLVVHGLMLDLEFDATKYPQLMEISNGFSMFELGKVGGLIALAGIAYIVIFGNRRLPNDDNTKGVNEGINSKIHIVEAVIGPRFPGINKSWEEFDFKNHYNADIIQVRRAGNVIADMQSIRFREGDTLVLSADEQFIPTWGDSSVFLLLSNDSDYTPKCPTWKKWTSLGLLVLMIAGATLGDTEWAKEALPGLSLDMFFWACVVAVIMAFCNIFPPKKYSKFISWDILITIASALSISTAMTKSGLADWVASSLIGMANDVPPIAILGVLYLVTNIITELITNNAAAAFAFPIAVAISTQMGVSPMPFMVAICIAASSSFSSPIGYQTNMIVQGIGGYKFGDFIRIGLPLNIIAFIISMIFIPLFWPF